MKRAMYDSRNVEQEMKCGSGSVMLLWLAAPGSGDDDDDDVSLKENSFQVRRYSARPDGVVPAEWATVSAESGRKSSIFDPQSTRLGPVITNSSPRTGHVHRRQHFHTFRRCVGTVRGMACASRSWLLHVSNSVRSHIYLSYDADQCTKIQAPLATDNRSDTKGASCEISANRPGHPIILAIPSPS